MTMNAYRRSGLVVCGLLLVGACGGGPGASEDCQTDLHFSSETYTMVTGRNVGTVEPGRLLGSGDFAHCDDRGGPGGSSRQVHALPDVSPQQAVVLLGGNDRGTVYINAESPTAAWDADLVALLDAWSVQPPA